MAEKRKDSFTANLVRALGAVPEEDHQMLKDRGYEPVDERRREYKMPDSDDVMPANKLRDMEMQKEKGKKKSGIATP